MRQAIHCTLPLARAFEPGIRQSRPVTSPGALRAAVLCTMALLAAPAAFGQTSDYDIAHVDYEIGHFERAFAVFASLADEGHCDAARMAQQMVRYGRPLYAIDFKVAPERVERWQNLPGCPMAVAVADRSTERRAP